MRANDGTAFSHEPVHEQLQVMASETLALQGDVHRLVTFLNQALKEHGFIFGLKRAGDDEYRLTIYRG